MKEGREEDRLTLPGGDGKLAEITNSKSVRFPQHTREKEWRSTQGSLVTHRCEDHKKLHKEMRCENDHEVRSRVPDDLVEDRGDL